MFKSYSDAMRNYATFSGRMSRAAYWQFIAICFAITIVALILDVMLVSGGRDGIILRLVTLVHLIPNLAASTRRLHDSDKSAWWLLILITGIGGVIIGCFSPTPGPNRYGQQPNDLQSTNTALAGLPSSPTASQATGQPSTRVDIVAELERLAALRTNGSLSDSEYEVMKSRLLSRQV